MSTIKQVAGTRTQVTISGLSTLSNFNYATSNAINNTTNQPLDLLVELNITPGTTANNKQAILYALGSLDGTNYQSGVSSTDETDMTYIGTMTLNAGSSAQTKMFGVASQFGGSLPPYLKFVVKNDSGAAFTAGTLYMSEISATVA